MFTDGYIAAIRNLGLARFRWKKLQYYIQIEHIKVKIEANKENHIKNYPAFS
jgi:hypothetical protein